MLLVGATHVLFGVLFLSLSTHATDLLVVDPPERSVLLVRGLGGILIAIGTTNVMARNSTDVVGLRAVLFGTLLYFFFTVGFDVRWALSGLLRPAAWITISVRALFAIGYAWYLVTLRVPER